MFPFSPRNDPLGSPQSISTNPIVMPDEMGSPTIGSPGLRINPMSLFSPKKRVVFTMNKREKPSRLEEHYYFTKIELFKAAQFGLAMGALNTAALIYQLQLDLALAALTLIGGTLIGALIFIIVILVLMAAVHYFMRPSPKPVPQKEDPFFDIFEEEETVTLGFDVRLRS